MMKKMDFKKEIVFIYKPNIPQLIGVYFLYYSSKHNFYNLINIFA